MKAMDANGQVGYHHGELNYDPLPDQGISARDMWVVWAVLLTMALIIVNDLYLVVHGV